MGPGRGDQHHAVAAGHRWPGRARAPDRADRRGSGRQVDIIVGTNTDDWRLWLVVSGAIGQITDEILTGPVRTYGYQSLAAYGLSAPDRARRLPGAGTRRPARVSCSRRSRPTGGCGSPPFASRTRTPRAGGDIRHLHVRVRLGRTRDSVRFTRWRCRSCSTPSSPTRRCSDHCSGATRRRSWLAQCTPPGSPSPAPGPGWPRYDLAHRATMRFDTTSEVVDDPRSMGAGPVGRHPLTSRGSAPNLTHAGDERSVLRQPPRPTCPAESACGRVAGYGLAACSMRASARARPAGRGQPSLPGSRPGRARRDRGGRADLGCGPRGCPGPVSSSHAWRGRSPSTPEVNARKAGNHILSFDRVDIGATVERHWQGRTVLDIVVVRDADRRSCAEITDMLHRAKFGPGQAHPQRGLTRAAHADARADAPGRHPDGCERGPTWRRRSGRQLASPRSGCSPSGWGWAIPLAPLTRDRHRRRRRGATSRPPRRDRGPAHDAVDPQLRPRRRRRRPRCPLHRDATNAGRDRRGVQRHRGFAHIVSGTHGWWPRVHDQSSAE